MTTAAAAPDYSALFTTTDDLTVLALAGNNDGVRERCAEEGVPLKLHLLRDPPSLVLPTLLQSLREQCAEPEIVYESWTTVGVIPRLTSAYRPAGRPLILVKPLGGYARGNILGDLYNEAARLQARRYDQAESPADIWRLHFPQILEHCRATYPHVSRYYLRESLWRYARECTAFPPALFAWVARTLHIYDTRFPQHSLRMLDCASGWGCRLTGAIASGMVSHYTGVDPSSALHDGYARIVRDLAPPNFCATFLCNAFEDLDVRQLQQTVPRKQFDIVFTSPPFYTAEIYDVSSEDRDKQSVWRYRTMEQWLHEFLWPTLQASFALLAPGGYMVVHLQDVLGIGELYVERTLGYLQRALGPSTFCGAIGLGKRRLDNPDAFLFVQPLWVWQKARHN